MRSHNSDTVRTDVFRADFEHGKALESVVVIIFSAFNKLIAEMVFFETFGFAKFDGSFDSFSFGLRTVYVFFIFLGVIESFFKSFVVCLKEKVVFFIREFFFEFHPFGFLFIHKFLLSLCGYFRFQSALTRARIFIIFILTYFYDNCKFFRCEKIIFCLFLKIFGRIIFQIGNRGFAKAYPKET